MDLETTVRNHSDTNLWTYIINRQHWWLSTKYIN